MTRPARSYHGYRFPPEIISHAVWLYYRFCLSFRDVEDLLALMHGSTGNQQPPPLVPRSVHSRTLGHSQGRHAVQDLAAHSGFHPLTLQRSGPDHRTDDGLVPTHRGVGQTSLAVAGPGVPRALSEARSRSDVAIALSGARGLRTELRVLRRWYEHPWRAALTVSLYRSVDSLGVVGRGLPRPMPAGARPA